MLLSCAISAFPETNLFFASESRKVGIVGTLYGKIGKKYEENKKDGKVGLLSSLQCSASGEI